MTFVYKKWDEFCSQLKDAGMISIPACEVTTGMNSFLVLKHDVETNVPHAYKMASIEAKYGHRGSYYVQAYLLEDAKNIQLLKDMQSMGHEVSYHYDVMDSCHGVLDDAIADFEENKRLFESNGFAIQTVCQHGNPLVERIGYTSNRDFFRSDKVKEKYPHISDIMVNFKEMKSIEYNYYSDAGRLFKLIYDPINNDRVNTDDKNVPFENLRVLLNIISKNGGSIISTHPHRWTNSVLAYKTKSVLFKGLKIIAKAMYKVPGINKIMNRYYYLAKKI